MWYLVQRGLFLCWSYKYYLKLITAAMPAILNSSDNNIYHWCSNLKISNKWSDEVTPINSDSISRCVYDNNNLHEYVSKLEEKIYSRNVSFLVCYFAQTSAILKLPGKGDPKLL